MSIKAASTDRTIPLQPLLLLGGLVLCLIWAYWPTFAEMASRWYSDSQYSHGFIVPIFSAVLLYLRRDMLKSVRLRFHWLGLVLVAIAGAFRVASAHLYFEWLDGFSLLCLLAGMALMLGGVPALNWSWPAIGFLIFMIPLPYTLQIAMGFPLQRIATVSSTFLLQTLGLPALSEGNTIWVNEHQLGVVEACNGLGMLMVFFALSAAVAFLIQRPWPEKVLIVVSAIPIAIIVNVIRITVTGILYVYADPQLAHYVFHDLAGYLMPILALGMLWGELKLVSLLFIEEEYEVAGFSAAKTGLTDESQKEKESQSYQPKGKARDYSAAKAGLIPKSE